MQRVFRVVNTADLHPVGVKATGALNRSVRRHGVLTPVLLAEVGDADGVIQHAIIDGHRRIRAARAARLPRVPAVVLRETTEQDRARLTLMCNYLRSGNFHTESSAILALADTEDAVAGAARAIGVGPAKMQQLYRKIATMPEPVRRAMEEHRIPVTAAAWVGAWPEGLQREIVDLLARRRHVTTTMLKDLRERYAQRHPEAFGLATPARDTAPSGPWVVTGWHGADLPGPDTSVDRPTTGVERDGAAGRAGEVPPPIAAPAMAGARARAADVAEGPVTPSAVGIAPDAESPGARGPATPGGMSGAVAPAVEPPAVEHATGRPAVSGRPAHPEPLAVTPPAAPDPRDATVERMIAYVVRLDAALGELAREGRALGIERAVWVDRAMRAWDGAGG